MIGGFQKLIADTQIAGLELVSQYWTFSGFSVACRRPLACIIALVRFKYSLLAHYLARLLLLTTSVFLHEMMFTLSQFLYNDLADEFLCYRKQIKCNFYVKTHTRSEITKLSTIELAFCDIFMQKPFTTEHTIIGKENCKCLSTFKFAKYNFSLYLLLHHYKFKYTT